MWNIGNLFNLSQDKVKLLKQLCVWGLIPKEGTYKCPVCLGNLKLYQNAIGGDGWKWHCTNKVSINKQKAKKCGKTIEFRTGTFFQSSKLSIFQILTFVNLWCRNAPLEFIKEEVEIASGTAVNWASFCREVVLRAFLEHPDKLGGPGVVVQIDESKFGKRKYHRGNRVEGQCVVGGYERGTGKIFMIVVENSNADTLLPIITELIHPGTTIISDYWRAYDCLENEGYLHLKVNHSITFKDPETGAHTNSIESSWSSHAKTVVSSCGRKIANVPGNFARFLFYKRCNETKKDRTDEFLALAGKLYDPTKKADIIEEEYIAPEEDVEELDMTG